MISDALVEENLGLVHACARRFIGKGIEYDDLYAAGCLGLTKALQRFDPARGYRLSTYAVPVILGEIKQLFRDGGSVKVSRGLRELSLRARDITERYCRIHGEEISISKLAMELGVDVSKAAEALNVSSSALSLSSDDDGEQIEIAVDGIEDTLCERMSLNAALGELSQDERTLIEWRYYRHKTQAETAAEMGTTQVGISRREKKILTKLRTLLAG